jgi:hypothetical protein
MKKLITIFVTLIVLSIGVLPVAAQTRARSNRSIYNERSNTRYDRRYDRNVNRDSRDVYRNDNYRYDNDDSFWDQHRDKITTAGGAAGGAILGGLIGGKKGAIIGAITGGAGAALYTYKIRNKDRRY